MGSFTVVLREGNQMGIPKGSTFLAGTWTGDPTLSVSIMGVDQGGGKFPLDVKIMNSIEVLDPRGGGRRGGGVEYSSEPDDDFVMKLAKADDFGGHYEFEFHRKGARWYRALLPWTIIEGTFAPPPGRFALVAARFNSAIVDPLVAGALTR